MGFFIKFKCIILHWDINVKHLYPKICCMIMWMTGSGHILHLMHLLIEWRSENCLTLSSFLQLLSKAKPTWRHCILQEFQHQQHIETPFKKFVHGHEVLGMHDGVMVLSRATIPREKSKSFKYNALKLWYTLTKHNLWKWINTHEKNLM